MCTYMYMYVCMCVYMYTTPQHVICEYGWIPFKSWVLSMYFPPVILIRKTHPWAFWMYIVILYIMHSNCMYCTVHTCTCHVHECNMHIFSICILLRKLAIILLPLKYPIWIMAKLRQFSHFLQQIKSKRELRVYFRSF